MINTRYPVPFIAVSGQIMDGTTSKVKFADLYDLAGSVSVGLYDAETNAIATATGNGKRFFIGYSSEHTKDFIDKFLFGAQLPKGNPYWEFRGEDIISFEYSDPTKIKSEKWVLGYDGSEGCNITAPKFECGKIYGVSLMLSGSPTFRRWAKVLQHEIFTDPICCDDDFCATGCSDNLVDCGRIVKELAYKINNHNELMQLGVKARYITNDYSAPTANMNKYQISVVDDGSETAMALVKQTAGADSNIVRVTRVGATSTYEVCAVSSPTTYQQPAQIALPTDCDVCPAGSTTVAGTDVYVVIRPLAGTEDLTTTGAQQTYANGVKAVYVAPKVFNGATAVDPATNQITVTAHGLVVGDAVTYSNGGGTTIVGLTNNTVYYVQSVPDVNNVTLAATKGGAVVDITADGVGASHSLTLLSSATFLSQNGALATVQISVPVGTVAPVASASDVVTFVRTVGVQCTIAAPSAIAWTQTGTAYRSQRTLCLTLPRKDCAEDVTRLAELQAYYANNPYYKASSLVVAGESDGCSDTYNLVQWSKGCMEDGCLSSDTAFFEDFGAYENNLWEVVETVPTYDANRKCGLEITASVPEQYISDCELELEDFYETEPIRLEVSWIIDSLTGFPTNCDMKNLPKAKRVQSGQNSRQDGEWVLREYIKAGAYEMFGEDYNMPSMRRVLDAQRRKQVDRSSQYRLYYLQAKIHRQGHNFDQQPEVIEATFAIPFGDQKAAKFESAFLAPLSKFGVELKERK